MAFSGCFFANRKPRKACFFNRPKGDDMTINTSCYEAEATPRKTRKPASRATDCAPHMTPEMSRAYASHTVRMSALRGDLPYLREALAAHDRAFHSARAEARRKANSPWAPVLDEDPCAAVPKGLNECRASRRRSEALRAHDVSEPITEDKHRKIADFNWFEIWKTPTGWFEVYSPTSRIGLFSAEDRALEYVAVEMRRKAETEVEADDEICGQYDDYA